MSSAAAAEVEEEGTRLSSAMNLATTNNLTLPQQVHHASLVKKKNRFGFWQKRYFEMNGDQLTYYKTAAKKKPLHQPMKVEYCQLDDRFGGFSLQTDQKEFYLQAPSLDEAQEWVVAVETAEAEADKAEILKEFQASKLAKEKPQLSAMEGFLQIRSASRVKGWKDGFFRLEPCMIVYYKDNLRSQEDYESQIVFNSKCTVEKKVEKPTQFKLRTQVNTYTFKAPSVDAANDWVTALQIRINMDQNDDDEDRLQEMIEAPPKWMVDWDRETPEDQVIQIQTKLDNLFARKDRKLESTLLAVTTLIEELEDRAQECLPLNGDPNAKTESGRTEARPDIFQVILRFYHIRIVDELSQFVSLDQNYEQFTQRDLLSCMDLISAYNAKLEEIFKGEVGMALEEKIPPFGMLDNAENMAAVYLDKCGEQISGWVDNVTETSSRKVEIRTDGKYQTTSPALLLNLLNEALVLAKRSGMKRLQTDVLALCAVCLGDFMHATVSQLHKTSSFSYCIACANDCWSVMDYIGNFLKMQGNDEYDVSFSALEEMSAAEADKCLGVIASMVQDDLKQTLATAFTQKHLESTVAKEDTMAIVCATCDDYLESFAGILEMPFVIRLSRMMMSSIVSSYLARFGSAYRDEGLKTLTKKQIELIRLDRNRLTECLQTRLPSFAATLIEPEFGALDDVLDMLSSPLAYIPATAVKLVEHNEMLRDHMKEIGKMMIELSPLGAYDTQREVKALLETELARLPVAPQAVETDLTNPFVRMWPLRAKKQQVTGQQQQMSRADSKAQLLRDTAPMQRIESAASEMNKKEIMRRQQSSQWAPPTKQASLSQVGNGQQDALLSAAPVLQAILHFSPSLQAPHEPSLCVIRRCAGEEYELVVYKGKLATGPLAFQSRMSEISRIEFCEGNKNVAMLLGEDGRKKKDTYAFSRTANTQTEFSVIKKKGNTARFSVVEGGNASKWIKELQLRMQETFSKGFKPAGVSAPVAAPAPVADVQEEESYSDMSTKQLKALGSKRGLDMSSCVERRELIEMLERDDLSKLPPKQESPVLVSMLRKPSVPTSASGLDKKSSVKFVAPPQESEPPVIVAAAPRVATPPVVVAAPRVVTPPAPAPVVTPPAPAPRVITPPAPTAAASRVITPPAPAPVQPMVAMMGLDSNEEKMIEIQMLIFQGHSLVEDENPKEAVPLFKRAKEYAEQINSTQLKAKASTGLASAYRDIPNMRRAAAPLFEVAATLFATTGDTSDRINVLSEAADIYVSQGEYAQAVRCLSRFDKAMVQSGSLPVFAARIQEIQALSTAATQ